MLVIKLVNNVGYKVGKYNGYKELVNNFVIKLVIKLVNNVGYNVGYKVG